MAGAGAVTEVASGYQFVEGPQWRAATGDLLFSDIPAATIYRWAPGAGVPTVFRAASGNSNGLALDPQGTLVACEHGGRRVARGDGEIAVTIVDRFEGARLNSPNDAVVRADGTIYFTDPPFGITDAQRELAFMGTFRVTPAGAVSTVRRGALDERPNGIALSPDAAVLYVGDADHALVRAYDVDAAGATTGERVFTTTAATPDGLAVDAAGNLFVATAAGVEAFAPDGRRWGVLAVPQQPSNVGFGGADARTLFVTARTAVYQVTLANPGLPRN
ncbi:MAG: SMP-30/gluconolactonase/LRE family protein [Myxococcales bacterium]|nr:SMP-30/gluconolactonase/LRE family protein [Myxococcales bacterium]